MRLSTMSIFLLAAVFQSAACRAQTTTIVIERHYSKYPYQCMATSCFRTNQERESSLANLKTIADKECSAGWVKDVGKESCLRAREEFEAAQTCERSLCVKAKCKMRSSKDGFQSCSGVAYFE